MSRLSVTGGVTVKCAACGTKFIPKRRGAKYCGDACRVFAHRQKQRVRTLPRDAYTVALQKIKEIVVYDDGLSRLYALIIVILAYLDDDHVLKLYDVIQTRAKELKLNEFYSSELNYDDFEINED